MKKLKRPISVAVLLMLVVSLFAGCGTQSAKPQEETSTQTKTTAAESEKTTESEKPKEKVVVRVLDCWNGSSQDAPADFENNPVAKKILEKTNVVFKIDNATTNETEKLNMMFAAGDVQYDLIFAPYWGGDGGECGVIKRAGSQNLLKPLEDLISKYGENIKPALTTNLRKSFVDNDMNYSGYNGHTYVVPYETHATDQDYRNEGMGLYARKDIMDALGWKQDTFNSSEKVYEYLKLVKGGSFKDAAGKAVIPAGTWHDGWEAVQYAKSYKDNSQFGLYTYEGKTYAFQRGPLFEKQVLFIRKLVADGLFDKAAFSQNDTSAKEMMAIGKYAVVPGHFFHFRDNLRETLYKTNPDMQYVPIGPIPNQDGTVGEKRGMAKGGSPAWFIPASTKDDVAEATIKAINWLNSKEGKILPYYGVEGVHYDLVNGKPVTKDEYLQKYKDGTLKKEEGVQATYMKMVSLRPFMSEWGEFSLGDSKSLDANYQYAVTKVNPYIPTDDGVDLWTIFRNDFKKDDPQTYESIDKVWLKEMWPDVDNKYRERAYLAKSDDEALKILNVYEKRLIDAGIEKFEDYCTKNQKDKNIKF